MSVWPQILPRLSGRVDFDHVDFHYNPGKPIIRDFTLHVAPGQTVALIGPTGCGKSTLLSLLLRFFDVTGGALRLDGHDIRKVRLAQLRRQFGIVLQEPQLFTASIADNIRYARPGATQTEIETAARTAEIHDFIMTLPNGYNTLIGVEGTQLSTGQKQRITIARAVAANPAILIMDEATSALDSESEQAIQLAMERLLKNRTAFIVAHRLSTIRTADVIILMNQGQVLEQGCHDDLMKIPGGHYAAIYAKFMGRGTLDESQTV
jgi:ABC-type multidrug transport system fused ATPase/permease subunit